MSNRHANPYSSPFETTSNLVCGSSSRPFSVASRIGAGAVSVLIYLFSIGGFLFYRLSVFYLNPDPALPLFSLAMGIGLALIATFWIFFATVGHKAIPRAGNILVLGATGVVAIPSCFFVLRLLF